MNAFHPPIHEPPERVSIICPLGLQFLDVATGALGPRDLQATARPAGAPPMKNWPLTTPVATPSGVLAFHGLPGLREFENSDTGGEWKEPPSTRKFQIELADPFGRFLPCTFVVTAPTHRLTFFADDNSPPWSETGAVPLFSAPPRPVPGGLAVVRAELRELGTGKPAAWAVMEANYFSGGAPRVARGMADDKGRIVLLFAYPEGQRRAFNGSPRGNGGIWEQQWTLDLSFHYQFAPDPEERADYSVRLAQPSALAWRGDSPLTLLSEKTLSFGRELNLETLYLAPA